MLLLMQEIHCQEHLNITKMTDKDVTQKNMWNTKQVISIISFVIICTFYGTVTYLQIQSIESRLNKKIQIINENTDEINKLKQKNSDN